MRALDLKLFRDLRTMKGQMIAIAIVMACGLMVMIMERGLVVSLESAKNAHYSEHRLADLFSDLKHAPNTLRKQLMEVPDIAVLETRVKGHARLDIPGMEENAEGMIISIPDDQPQQLNKLYLRNGRLPHPGNKREIVISEAFAGAHHYQPGDTIDALISGSKETLQIVGIALSPEYVYELAPGSIMPDNKRFGVFWMSERELSSALGLKGGFNNVIAELSPNGDLRTAKKELDKILKPYGGLSAYDRENNPTIRIVDEEIKSLKAAAVSFPAVFLSIAAFMTSAALTRLIHLQREQIAQLKAFGYSSRSIALHYFKYALVVVALATTAGAFFGQLFGSLVLPMYGPFFHFPSLVFIPDRSALLYAIAASAGLSFISVFSAVRQVLKLPAAEAMRPEPPAEYRPSLLEKVGLQTYVPPLLRMALRNLERKPWQAVFTTCGLALATALPIISIAMGNGMDHMMDFQWRQAQRQDATLSLIEPSSYSTLSSISALPGVKKIEPFRSVPAKILNGHHSQMVAITGLEQNTQLFRLLNTDGRPVALPSSGLLLSAHLAQTLGAQPGDTVRLEVQEGRRPTLDAVVSGTITDYAGVSVYMEVHALNRLMKEGNTINGAHLSIDDNAWSDFLKKIKDAPRVGSVTITKAARDAYDKIMGEMMGISQAIFSFFAIVVAFGVIYNGARIALSERSRDLATLRVLGFTRTEVSTILISELALLTILALIPGMLIGRELTRIILAGVSSEAMRIPVVITEKTYVTALIIILISAACSFAVVGRRIMKLDLLGVLKARE